MDKPLYLELLYNCNNPKWDGKNRTWRKCGECENCKRQKTNEWKLRCRHELITNEKAVYFTLTYAKTDGELHPQDTTKFLKRLRKYFKDIKLKYVYCGEYGPKKHRPHYHFLVFGINWKDFLPKNEKDYRFLSNMQKDAKKTLRKIWKLGHVDLNYEEIGDNCVRYILGYVRKKQGLDFSHKIQKPFKRQSQGIGKDYALKTKELWTKTMFFQYEKSKLPIPRYYQKLIYQEEGIIRRRITPTLDLNENKYGKRYSYDVFKNPNGKYTQIMLKKLEELSKDRIKFLKETFDGYDLDFTINKMRIENEYNLKKSYWYYNEYKDIGNFTIIDELRIINLFKKKNGQMAHYRLSQIPDFCKKSASQIEYILRTSPYGWRDKIELLT